MIKNIFLKSTKVAAISIALAVGSVGIAQAGGPGKADFDKLRAEVMSLADKAASVEGEWRDLRWKKSTFVKWKNAAGETVKGSFVGVADAAAAEGNYVKAMELLKTAKFQAEMGYQQAMEQKNAGPRL